VPQNIKITSKIVEEIVSEVAGEDVLPLVKALRNKSNVSEFKLADSIKKEINLTRNMLYRLYDNNLVSFIRKKDKKKGWYIYYWTFNVKRVKDLIGGIKKKKFERLNERLQREKNTQFYICVSKCVRLDFEQSHDFNFKCPECGQLLDIDDNSKKIMELEASLVRLEKELRPAAKAVVKAPVKVSKPTKKSTKKKKK
jgi:transcription initiation factor TFIIE subunit alpha